MKTQPTSLARPVQCLYGIALEREELKLKALNDSKSICCVPFESKDHYTCMTDGELLTTIIEEKKYLIIATLSTGGMIS
ncbi:hypothetical protein ACFOWA_20030 [Pedobacter lithocola]|uniref:Uncharacterized protein n=1 Tax=Pedobacter lithocola TaxID=1908239 RepID=A0ABV8PHE4_9SPHI